MNLPFQIPADDFRDLLRDDPRAWMLEEDKHWALMPEYGLRYRLPMTWPLAIRGESMESYMSRIPDETPVYTIVMVQLGSAAIGHVEYGELVAHKSIKKYMKRHKRGKAQIQYLNTRGKSKAGSRVRLANTERFFEEINERLSDWIELFEAPELLLISCTPNVWGMMFQADPLPPFDKKDPRIRKIPYDVGEPDYEQLQKYKAKLEMAVKVEG